MENFLEEKALPNQDINLNVLFEIIEFQKSYLLRIIISIKIKYFIS